MAFRIKYGEAFMISREFESGLTTAPADSGYAAAGTHSVCKKWRDNVSSLAITAAAR
jgi:hypothetical protein